MDSGFQKKDYGMIKFGIFAYKKKWSQVRRGWLEFVVSDDCNTDIKNKEIAQKELEQRRICEGQLDLLK